MKGNLSKTDRQIAAANQRLHGLIRAARAISSSLDHSEVLKTIVREAALVMEAGACTLKLLDSAGEHLLWAADVGVPAEWRQRPLTRSGEGLVGWVAAQGEPLALLEPLTDPRVMSEDFWTRLGFASYLGVPVKEGGRTIGVLSVCTREPRCFSEDEIALALSFADQAAIALRNARRYEEQVRSTAEARELAEIARVVVSARDVKKVLREVCRRAAALCGADRCSIYLEGKAATLVPAMSQYASGERNEEDWLKFKELMKRGRGKPEFFRRVIESRRALTLDNARASDLDQELVDAFRIGSILGVPLVAADQVIGVATLDTVKEVRPFTSRQVELAVTVADHVAFAVQKALLLEETQGRLWQAEAHLEIAETLSSTLELKPLLKQIAQQAARACQMDRCSIYLLEGEQVVPVMSQYADGRADRALREAFKGLGRMRVDEIPFFAETVKRRGPVVIDNPDTDPLVPRAMEVFQLKQVLALPLIRQERVVGALAIDNCERSRPVTAPQVAFATTIASQVALAIDNARLYDETERRLRETTGLLSVAQTLSGSLDLQEIARRTTRELTLLFGADTSIFFQSHDAGEYLVGVAGYHIPEVLRNQNYRVSQQELFPWVLEAQKTGRPVASTDVSSDPLFDHPLIRNMPIQPKSALFTPLLSKGRQLAAIYSYWWTTPHKFTEEELRLAEGVATQIALALDNARLYEETERRRRGAEELAQVARTLTEHLELEAVATRVVEGTRRLLSVASATLFQLQPDRSLLCLAASGGAGDLSQPGLPADVVGDPEITLADVHQSVSSEGHAVLLIPLRSKGAVIGLLTAAGEVGRIFTDAEVSLARSFADQVALAMENARLYADARRRQREAESLAEVGRHISQPLNPQEVQQQIVDGVRSLLQAQVAALFQLDPESGALFIIAGSGDHGFFDPSLPVPPGVGIPGLAISERSPMASPDIMNDPRLVYPPEARANLERAPFRSVLCVPLIVKEQAVGVLGMGDRLGRVFTNEEMQLAQAFADQAALAMEHARLYADARRRQREAESLAEVGRHISQSLNPQEVQQQIVDSVRFLFHAQISYLFRLDPKSGALLPVTFSGDLGDVDRSHALPAGVGLPHLAVSQRQPVVSLDIMKDRRLTVVDPETKANYQRASFRSALCVPLIVKEHVIGVLGIGDRLGRIFTDAETQLAQAFADQAAMALENARLFEETAARRRVAEALLDIGQAVGSTLKLKQVLKVIAQRTAQAISAERCALQLLRGEELVPVMGQFADGHSDPVLWATLKALRTYMLDEAPAHAQAIRTKRAVAVEDATTNTLIPTSWVEALRIRSALVIPLVHQDQVIGALMAERTDGPSPWSQEQIDLAMAIANQAALAIENARMFEETKRRAQEQATLTAIATAVSQSHDLDELLEIAMDKVLEVTGRELGTLRLKDPVTGKIRLVSHRGLSARYVEAVQSGQIPTKKDILIVLEMGQSVVLNDRESIAQLEFHGESDVIHALAIVPLKAEGKVVGALAVATTRPAPFLPREVELLEAIGNVVGVAVEKARLFDESRRLVDELQTLTQELQLKNKELDTFVYTVSHDLKAPLVTLQGMAELLMESSGKTLDEQGQHFLNRLKANARQMEQLILDLLTLSRIGRETCCPEAVPLGEVVDQILGVWDERIRAKGIRVTCHELPALWGVKPQIEQVVGNLIGNAVKYSGEPAEPVIEIGAKDAAGEGGDVMVECYVRDNGIGIDPAYHEKVFEIFQRLKETESEGTGVGLAIVKKIVEGAGGRIWVESTRGQGATFRFTWPKAGGARHDRAGE